MTQNEIEEMLDHLRRINSGGNLDSVKINRIEKLEMVLKYHHILLPDSLVKLTEKAKWIVEMLQWVLDGIPNERKTNLNLRRLESHLLEFFEGKTSFLYNYELNDFDLSKYMDDLGKNLNDVLTILLEKVDTYMTQINGYVNHEKLECLETRIQFMGNNVDTYDTYEYYLFDKPPYVLFLIVLVELEMKKIFLKFFHHLHSLLMYLRNKKLENFPNNNSARNIDVAIEFLLVFLDADVANHVINGNWLNEVMDKV
ncbi:hypothetical protein R3W88_025051 [Solanum pinnatisectum]|uniref:Uncharacterized protein n=1 Tax=Solanum pinnatisectum TaxID=50273 RepID=A0AAV9M2X4_9SOLN|nr:hypothetical protein R3W88_025051 [Solanum pinnatisectum]